MDETPATVAPVVAPAPPKSIGQRLRAGRERAGLSVAAAAEKLHLDTKVIDALEADRFAELGASVYVRGHLRRYADFVGEPGSELVESYVAKEARPPPPDLTQIPQAGHRADPRRLVNPLTALAGVLALALAIWWVLSGGKSGTPVPAAPPAEHPAPVMSAPAPAPAAVADTQVPADALARNASASAAPRSPASEASSQPPRPESTTPVRSTGLKLELTNDSWVEIYDARNQRLFYDVASAGSVLRVEGRPPLKVVLGNSGGVAVEVDGQRREIPSAAADGEGARFVVNRSGSLARAR